MERIVVAREQVGAKVKIRLDANQGWQPKEAVNAINQMEKLGLNIELIEQPVKAKDFRGLQFVTQNTNTPIMADESVFSVNDALRIIRMNGADLFNIKLMKSGGIHEALKIAQIANAYGVKNVW